MHLVWNAYYIGRDVPHVAKEMGTTRAFEDILRLSDYYRGIGTCQVRNGNSVLFWNDLWHGSILAQYYPRLYSSARNK